MKRLFAVLLIAVMLLGLVACGDTEVTETTTYDVTIWVSEVEGVKELTLRQIEAFNAANKDVKFNATVEGVTEGNAATQMIADVETGADIYCFAQDQLARLIQSGALAPLGSGTAAKVKDENSEGSVSCATFGETLYAFPITDDNGYFMYYDKSVIPADKVGSLEDIVAICESNNKLFCMDLEGSAWYAVSFFFGVGCVSEWTTDNDGNFTSVNDTFNSATGMIAAEAMQKLVKSTCFHSSANAADFSSGAAVVVSGTWDYNSAKAALGDNFGVAELPSFKSGSSSYHLASFNGCKLMGMKPQADNDRASAIQRLAYYLAGETCQSERFDSFGWGPSNKAVAASEKVQSNPTLNALASQNKYARPQGQIHGSWWDIGKAIATNLKAADSTEAGRQSALDEYTKSMNALFNMSDDEKNAWGVIGMYNTTDGFFFITDYSNETRSNWSDEAEMKEESAGVWVTKQAWDLPEGCEFKVRQGHSWDNAFPGDNFKVETAGRYYI